jgi:hypothetical protein
MCSISVYYRQYRTELLSGECYIRGRSLWLLVLHGESTCPTEAALGYCNQTSLSPESYKPILRREQQLRTPSRSITANVSEGYVVISSSVTLLRPNTTIKIL